MYRVNSDEEAAELANATVYGLGAAVFSKDTDRAERLMSHIDAGMLYINDFVQSSPEVPSGGTKDSGYGRECYKHGFHDISNLKGVIVNKQP